MDSLSKFRFLALAGMLSLGVPVNLFAQSVPQSAIDAAEARSSVIEQRQQAEIEEQSKELLLQQSTRGKALTEKPLEKPNSVGFKVLIKKIKIKDCEYLSEEFLTALKKEFEGKRLGIEEVNNVLRLITNRYISKSLITCRAILPKQDITSGILIVRCVEGVLESFDELSTSKKINARTAFPGLIGKVINLRDLEQGIDQLNRLPSNHVEMNLAPGSKTGDTIVVLENEADKPWRVIQNFDNSGFESTGEYQSRTTLQIDNFSNLNDQFTTSYGRDVTSKEDGNFSESASFAYSVPYGYWLFNATTSYFSYLSQIPIPQLDLSSSGTTWNFHLGGSYLFHRDQSTKSTFHFGLDYGIVENFFGDVKLLTSSRQVAIGKIGISHSRPFKKGYLNSTLELSHSLPIFNSFGTEDQIAPDFPDGNFGIMSWDSYYSRSINLPGESDVPLFWTSNLKMQYSPDQLFSSQSLGLGGRWSVRGFKDESIITRSGLYWRNDFSRPVLVPGKAQIPILKGLRAYVAHDIGTGFGGDRDPGQKGVIHGSAGGLRFRKGRYNGEFSVSVPLGAPDAIQGRDPVYYGAVTVTF